MADQDVQDVNRSGLQSRSEASMEIIGRQPGFAERWALFIFLGLLLLLAAGTWVVRYPDIVETRATLSAFNSPAEVNAPQQGRLGKLFVKGGQQVLEGDTITWIKSAIKSDLPDVVTAPISGTIFFDHAVQQGEFLEKGERLGYVMPVDMRYYARLYVPPSKLGNLDSGMQVQLRFDAYPYQEFGFVKGKLVHISAVASDSGFLATVFLDNNLQTNQQKTIPYIKGLKADALVITRDKRLLQTLYDNIVGPSRVKK
jgi:multidrug efflux pump subunit AcrA (membrane-fusion protein)